MQIFGKWFCDASKVIPPPPRISVKDVHIELKAANLPIKDFNYLIGVYTTKNSGKRVSGYLIGMFV